MPNIFVKLPAGVADAQARARLVAGINAAAAEAEQIADRPTQRFLCWVAIEEVADGHWTCGAADPGAFCVPVVLQVHVPAGVLDEAARALYVGALDGAVRAALAHEARSVMTSCIVNEVADGQWGVNGQLWRLKEFAAAAGYGHLRHLL